jgi:hypothetical protein
MNCAALLLSLLFFAAPFWETKAPEQWDQRELAQLLTDSPWAQAASGTARAARAPGDVIVFLATAGPMELAEAERQRRARLSRKPGQPEPEDPLNEEYQAWLKDNRATQIVVAVHMNVTNALSNESEIRRMEEDSVLHAGRKKLKMTGHFPPTASDPYMRIAFPRQVQLSDKNLVLELYLPGVPEPYRTAQFSLKDMVVMGKLEL